MAIAKKRPQQGKNLFFLPVKITGPASDVNCHALGYFVLFRLSQQKTD